MPVEPASHRVLAADFRLGDWLVRPSLNRLSRFGQDVQVEPRTIDVLAFLARHPGRVLTKEEILEAVWERSFVSEATLSHAVAELRRALGDDARRPRFIETIPKRGYRLIAAVAEADHDPAPPLPAPADPAAPSPSGVALRPARVLVVPFENRTGDEALEPLGVMAADWVSQGLSSLGLVEVIPFSSTLAAAALQGPSRGRSDDAVFRRAREAGAGTIVSGACYARGATIELQLRLSDAATGRLLVAPDPVAGPGDAPVALVEKLRERAMSAVAVQFDPALELAAFSPRRDTARRSRPPRFEAYREYLAGLEAFGSNDLEAIRRLRRAADLDPGFAAPLLLLEGVLLGRGDFAGAEAVLEQLEEHRDGLTPVEVEILAAKQADLAGRTAEALRHFSLALSRSPTDPVLRYQVATHELALGRPEGLIETYGALDLGLLANHPAILWLFGFLTSAQHVLGRFEDELETARRASSLHTARLPFVQPMVRALAALGRFGELSRVLESSRSLPPDGLTPDRVLATAVDELRAHGEPERAIRLACEALDRHRSRGNVRDEAAELHDEALLLMGAARRDEAKAVLALLADRFPKNVDYGSLLGAAAARAGDRALALFHDARLAREKGRWDRGRTAWARARIAASLGEADAALSLLAAAFAEGFPYGVSLHSDVAFEPLGGHPAFREMLRPKDAAGAGGLAG
jgi:DNA-binding winged helix-turn-helix (wHTH) protein/tetratricopeptide (TPR) repeat protein